MSGYRLIAVEKGGKVIAANIWGKVKTVTQMIAIILMFLSNFSYCQFVFRTATITEAKISSSLVVLKEGFKLDKICVSVALIKKL